MHRFKIRIGSTARDLDAEVLTLDRESKDIPQMKETTGLEWQFSGENTVEAIVEEIIDGFGVDLGH